MSDLASLADYKNAFFGGGTDKELEFYKQAAEQGYSAFELLNPSVPFAASVDPRLAISGGQAWPLANRAQFYKSISSGRASKLGYRVTAQSGDICLGIYEGTGVGRDARPGALKATTGSVACPIPGYAETALDVETDILATDWFALACTANAAFISATVNAGLGEANVSITTGLTAWQNAAFPLPANANPGDLTALGRTICIVGVL